MIYVKRGPSAVNVEPNETVHKVAFTVNSGLRCPVFMRCSDNGTGAALFTRFAPYKHALFGNKTHDFK